jgi:glucans biosynthesis protein C
MVFTKLQKILSYFKEILFRGTKMLRFHNLDFLRAFAMMMGLVMHAPLLFWQPDVAKVFGIENIAPAEEWINIIGRYINNWRMPLFFLLSGFFSVLIIKRKGTSQFIRDRLIRVGLTCLVFSSLYDIADGSFDFTTHHLWFLYELMIFVFCFSFLYRVQTIKDLFDREISTRILLILFLWLVATVPLANILNNWWHPLAWKPSTTYFDLKLGNIVYYFSYFLIGVIFYSNQHIFTKLKNSKTILAIGILAVLAFLLRVYSDYLTLGGIDDLRNLAQMQFDPIMVICNSLLIGVNTILWCLLFIGLTSKFIVSGSATLRWFVELSYPIYIIHIIPIAMMSALFYRAGLSQPVIFVLTIIAGFIVCVILYYILIKFTPLNWLINGYSKSPLKIKVWGR